jgi:hypothetical protein
MSAERQNGETTKQKNSFAERILSNPIALLVIGGVITAFISHTIEYRIFQDSPSKDPSSLGLFAIIFFTLVFFVAFWKTCSIWLGQRSFFREDFSFYSFLGITALFLTSFLSPFIRLTPWNICDEILKSILRQTGPVGRPAITDYVIYFLLMAILSLGASQWHSGWAGRKSVDHFRQEQNSERLSFFEEGWNEFYRRFVKGSKPPLEDYVERSQQLQQLDLSNSRSLSWEERAKELICLSSSSYSFNDKSAWHDLERCWVGENHDLDTLVVLYPLNKKIDQEEMQGFNLYAEKISIQRKRNLGELILAFRDDEMSNGLSPNANMVFETENTLLENLVDFTDYRNEIRRRVSASCLPDVTDIPLRVEDVYVDSKFSFLDFEHQSVHNVEEYILQWLNEPGHRQIALLGDYGQGKSTTTLMLTYNLLFQQPQPPKRIPILIELRGSSPKTLQPLNLLGAWAAPYHRIHSTALMQLHYAGRLLLIFEGFDEMAMVSNAEMRMGHFRRLWDFCSPEAKILITGRPNFFLDDEEKRSALGIDQSHGNKPYSSAIKLEPFTSQQINIALRNHSELVRRQICDFADRNNRFMEIVSRPSLLHIVADLWEKEKLSEKTDQLNSAAVMKLFVERSYRRQGLKEGDNRRFMALNSAERDYFMQGIASYMAAEDLNNQITSEALVSLIDKLIEVIPDSVSADTPAILGEESRPLSARLNEPLDYEDVRTDVRTCGLLVDDPVTPNTFKFGHKSFMEYLFASVVFDHLNAPDVSTEKSNAIFKATGAQLATLLKIPISVEFLAELLYVNHRSKHDINVEMDSFRAEIAIASRILKRVMKKNNISSWVSNGWTSNISLIELLVGKKKIHISFIQLLSFDRSAVEKKYTMTIALISSMGSALGALTATIFSNQVMPSSSSNDVSRYAVGFVFIMLYMIMVLQLVVSLNQRTIRELSVWNTICKKMNISDKAMHEAFGTSRFPWCKDKPFNYFIPKSNLEES